MTWQVVFGKKRILFCGLRNNHITAILVEWETAEATFSQLTKSWLIIHVALISFPMLLMSSDIFIHSAEVFSCSKIKWMQIKMKKLETLRHVWLEWIWNIHYAITDLQIADLNAQLLENKKMAHVNKLLLTTENGKITIFCEQIEYISLECISNRL